MFEVSVLNGLVDKWTEKMNISGVDLAKFYITLIGQTWSWSERKPKWLNRKDCCGNQEEMTDIGMMFHSDFDHREY